MAATAYDKMVDRLGVLGHVPPEISDEIIQSAPESSVTMSLGTRLRDMTRRERSLPVMSVLPMAFFDDGDTSLSATTNFSWEGISIDAEGLSVIVPIPINVLDDAEDAGYDLWAQIRPHIDSAFGQKVDQAILYGLNKPKRWPDGLVKQAEGAGQVIELSKELDKYKVSPVEDADGNVIEAGQKKDLYDVVMGEDGVLALVEEDGFGVTGNIGALKLKSKLRGLRDSSNQPIFTTSMQAKNNYALDGETIVFPKNGSVVAKNSLLISGDFSMLVFAIRKDIEFTVLKETVIQDPASGKILMNFGQQSMIGMRFRFRLGWALPNPVNAVNEDKDTRFMFSVLKP